MFFNDKKIDNTIQELIQFLAYNGFTNFECVKNNGFPQLIVDGNLISFIIESNEVLLTKNNSIDKIKLNDKMKIVEYLKG